MSLAPAADHALVLLRLLAGQAEPLPAAQIAARLGLPRSTVVPAARHPPRPRFRHPPGRGATFGLGLAAYEFGSAYSRQEPLQRLARPLVHRLVDTTTRTPIWRSSAAATSSTCWRTERPHRPLLITDVGVRLPAVTTASGRAMLARLPPGRSAPSIRAPPPSNPRWDCRRAGNGVGAAADCWWRCGRGGTRPRKAASPRAVVGRPGRTGPDRSSGRGCRGHLRLGHARRRGGDPDGRGTPHGGPDQSATARRDLIRAILRSETRADCRVSLTGAHLS